MTRMQTPARILLAEDDRIDARAFTKALAKLGSPAEVSLARDGLEAWEMLTALNGREAFAHADAMVVLDVNMPRMTGLELLSRIRNDASLRDAIVFIATTSESEFDQISACELNVAGYILKSDLANGLAKALQLMEDCLRARQPAQDWEFNPRC
jgi:CheY-like chemotaxis protein